MAPLFGTALARSGGGLLSHVVSAHPDATLARHPFLTIFRSLRDALVGDLGDAEVTAVVPPSAPLQDGYFSAAKRRSLDAILCGSLDLAVNEEAGAFIAAVKARCELESPELVAHLDDLAGATYREVFDNGLDAIARSRGGGAQRWVGFQEPWIIDFVPVLARAYPEARFLVVLRDPRAVVASMKGIARTDPDQVVNTVSYARHWRKYVALLIRFLDDPSLVGRMQVVCYERLVMDPEGVTNELADFLGVDHDPTMMDAAGFVDQRTGAAWSGNSSFETAPGTIDASAADRWRHTLDPDLHRLIDWLCGPDMVVAGYRPDTDDEQAALRALAAESRAYSSWRSDDGDMVADAGGELLRRALLREPGPADDDVLRRCFLFPEVRDRLLASGAPLIGPPAAATQ